VQSELAHLGRYRLLGVIAQGSMGTVFRSADPATGRPVAIKAVRRDPAGHDDNESLAARLRAEAELASRLAHPGIVSIHEYGEDAGYAFAVMEYVEGSSLRERFERETDFSPARSSDILSQLLSALQYAHDQGVWHRDVKPSNILLGNDGRVRLTDFGIAQSAAPRQTDTILGSAGYVAPESYLGEAFDHRVDIFAAAAVLYRLLAGVPAFTGTPDQIMFKVCHERPLPPSMVAGTPALQPYDPLVLQGLARRPEDRFANAAQFRAQLLALRRGR